MALLLTACAADGARNGAEPVRVVEIPLPDGVSAPSQQNSTGFTKDGSRIYLSVTVAGVEGRHLATIARDGSDFRCLTCSDLAAPDLDLRQPQLAADGRRFAVRSGSGVQRHSIVECTPSALECERAALVPVRVPEGVVPLLRNAQLRLAPGSEHALFTHVRSDGLLAPVFGEIVRETDHYAITNPRALAGFRPTFSGPADALRLAEGNWGEAKGFTDGGASIVYYTTLDALNFDSVKLDLATGRITRLTSHPEYDEDVHVSPDGEWVAAASFRNHRRMSVFSLVPRPPILDVVLRGPLVLLRNQRERRFFDLWILPIGRADDDAEVAWQLNESGAASDDPDISTRGQARWSPDGTQIAFVEENARTLGVARLMLATFTSRRPTDPVPTVPSPEPTWAPPISTVRPVNEQVTGTLRGPASGRADVSFAVRASPRAAKGDVRVTYVDYSADGCSFLNGTEAVTIDRLDFRWTADLTVAGCHEGSLTADVEGIAFPASAHGRLVTTYDGVQIEGVPQP